MWCPTLPYNFSQTQSCAISEDLLCCLHACMIAVPKNIYSRVCTAYSNLEVEETTHNENPTPHLSNCEEITGGDDRM